MVLAFSVVVVDSMRTVERLVISLDNFGDLDFEFRRKNPRRKLDSSALERWVLVPPFDKRE